MIGVAGPDFRYGFGLVNAGEALKILQNQQYFTDTLPLSTTQTHAFQIPANVVEARITLYWPDHEALPGASKALINDLTLRVSDTSSTTFFPLVPNSSPNLSALGSPAQPGNDSLNNIEVEVENHDPSRNLVTGLYIGYNYNLTFI